MGQLTGLTDDSTCLTDSSAVLVIAMQPCKRLHPIIANEESDSCGLTLPDSLMRLTLPESLAVSALRTLIRAQNA